MYHTLQGGGHTHKASQLPSGCYVQGHVNAHASVGCAAMTVQDKNVL